MLPTQGQGASQAIEDAEALGAFFEGISEVPSAEALSEILEVSCVTGKPRKIWLILVNCRTSSRLGTPESASSKHTAEKQPSQLLQKRRLLCKKRKGF